ncbi:MAG: gamma carbonic anhydrase family protein [Bacteroidota bacterium]
MALIQSVRGHTPQLPDDIFLAENATVIGDVQMGTGCTLWYNAVIRGDVNSIRIGRETNIQDFVMVHCTYQTASTTIGNRVSLGHHAVVHGCTIHDDVLIGMGAKVMDHAVVESDVLVAAGALVPPGKRLVSGFLYAGLPAKKVRPLTEDERQMIRQTAQNYQLYASWYREQH